MHTQFPKRNKTSIPLKKVIKPRSCVSKLLRPTAQRTVFTTSLDALYKVDYCEAKEKCLRQRTIVCYVKVYRRPGRHALSVSACGHCQSPPSSTWSVPARPDRSLAGPRPYAVVHILLPCRRPIKPACGATFCRCGPRLASFWSKCGH